MRQRGAWAETLGIHALRPVKAAALALRLRRGLPLLTRRASRADPESVADIAEGLQDTVVNMSTTQTLKGIAEKNEPPRARPQGLALRGVLRRFLR